MEGLIKRTSLLVFLIGLSLFSLEIQANTSDCLEHYNCELGEEEKTVACTDPVIDVVPLCLNPRLTSLSLKNTKIHTLYVTSVLYYSDLLYINLSNNSNLVKIQQKAFEVQSNVEELHLNNNKIDSLELNVFKGLKNLTVLNLHGNLLKELITGVFSPLQKLHFLDLSHNRIKFLNEDTFTGLKKLISLNLDHNKLKQIPSTSFKILPELSEISLGGNVFSTVNSHDFQYLQSLDSLDLSSTDVGASLNPSTFQFIRDVRKLKLNDCSLKFIPTTSLLHLKQLEEIELSRNQFEEIPENAFRTNTRLTSVLINGCPKLIRLVPGAFLNNLNILHLEISQNPSFTFLPPKELKSLSTLSWLDLHGNNLEYIPEDAVSWREVRMWYIHSNPLTCNCSTAWLRQMLIELNVSNAMMIKCATPEHLGGVPLASTDITDLRCGLDATTQGVVIGLSICSLLLLIACVAIALLYRHRGSCIRRLFKGKGRKWGDHHNSRRSFPYDSDYPPCIKDVPVTEL